MLAFSDIGVHEKECEFNSQRKWHCKECDETFVQAVEPKGSHSCIKRQKIKIAKLEEKVNCFVRGIGKLMVGLTAVSSKFDLANDRLVGLESDVRRLYKKRKYGNYIIID